MCFMFLNLKFFSYYKICIPNYCISDGSNTKYNSEDIRKKRIVTANFQINMHKSDNSISFQISCYCDLITIIRIIKSKLRYRCLI